MNKKKIIAAYLEGFKVNGIYELPDIALVGLMDEIMPPLYGGANTIYDESDDEERKLLIEDVRRCIEGEASITYLLVSGEGVKNDINKGLFDFSERHSVWYEITTN